MSTDPSAFSAPARVDLLFVCAANRARSPLMQAFAEAALDRRGLHWQVESGAATGPSGEPPLRRAQQIAGEWGLELRPQSRQLTDELVARSTLILVADRQVRSAVIAGDPTRTPRVHLLRQFAHWCQSLPPASVEPDAAALLSAGARARSRISPLPPADYELTDPVGGSRDAFRSCASRINEAIDALLVPLGP